jgi:hypothetical protein
MLRTIALALLFPCLMSCYDARADDIQDCLKPISNDETTVPSKLGVKQLQCQMALVALLSKISERIPIFDKTNAIMPVTVHEPTNTPAPVVPAAATAKIVKSAVFVPGAIESARLLDARDFCRGIGYNEAVIVTEGTQRAPGAVVCYDN